jgi:hypothetical protein
MKSKNKESKVEVIVYNYNAEKIADRIAELMPAIVNRMVRSEYAKDHK